MLGLLLIATMLFPFIAMPLLWRRMKRVRDGAYHARERAWDEQPWEEELASDEGLNLVRTSATDRDLIDLGNRAREPRWPIDNS
jgi:heme oxygenase